MDQCIEGGCCLLSLNFQLAQSFEWKALIEELSRSAWSEVVMSMVDCLDYLLMKRGLVFSLGSHLGRWLWAV